MFKFVIRATWVSNCGHA